MSTIPDDRIAVEATDQQPQLGPLAPSRTLDLIDAVEGFLRSKIAEHDHSGCAGYTDCQCQRNSRFAESEALLKRSYEARLETAHALRTNATPRHRQRHANSWLT